jgi:hypothetical protein
MKRLWVILTLAILNIPILGGCTGGWTKPGMTHSQLRTDVASCKFQVRRMVEEDKIPYKRSIMKQKLNECLMNKGYHQKTVVEKMAAPPMPDDLQIVQPDPSLPKELSAFLGKWEGSDNFIQFFLIVEKIDEEKASLYWWQSGARQVGQGWSRYEGNVTKERGKYKIWYRSRYGTTELTLKGKSLDWSGPTDTGSSGTRRFRWVP